MYSNNTKTDVQGRTKPKLNMLFDCFLFKTNILNSKLFKIYNFNKIITNNKNKYIHPNN